MLDFSDNCDFMYCREMEEKKTATVNFISYISRNKKRQNV